jgi:bifunctional aspartokinase / homoserine dehydrogenase 1
MQVLKFGGSSVANATNIKQVVNIIHQKTETHKTIVVVSALGGITDLLLKTAQLAVEGNETYKACLQEIETRHLTAIKELIPITAQSSTLSLVKKSCNAIEDICNGIVLLGELSLRTKDNIVHWGEYLSSQIITAKLIAEGCSAKWMDARTLIKTDSSYGNALVDFNATNTNIQAYFTTHNEALFIVPGFIASDSNGITTTLGRGGSDYTAAIFANAVNAEVLEIWTDVSGMMTADPRIVGNSKVIPKISYQEAMELSHFGAKVIYPPTIQPVMRKNIPVWVKNTFAPQDVGTIIQNEKVASENIVRGISCIKNISLLSLEGAGMVGIPGFSKRLFEALANHKINVILITQSSSEHAICVAIETTAVGIAKKAVDAAFAYEIEVKMVEPLIVEEQLSIVAMVGDQMKNHTGIAGKMFNALGKNGVNIRAIAQGSSERNISAVIGYTDADKAVNVLHEVFFETTYKHIHLFLTGVGNVGGKLLQQLNKQLDYVKQQHRLLIKVVGIANSKKVLYNEEGIDLEHWKNLLDTKAVETSLAQYVETIITKNLRNTIFVDVTANSDVAAVYAQLLQKNIAVIACNKIACSADYAYYRLLKSNATEYNAKFLFETNVGAGLPIIGTLNDLINSGDKIHKIEAVLSGTLNFVFNNYAAKESFASVMQQAQTEGYTEPDPRLDLSGKDVMRKLLILIRESGVPMEFDAIDNTSFMPHNCMQGTVQDFYTEMAKEEVHFQQLYTEAAAKDCKLKFVATYENGKASVGLKHIPPQSDFYHLYGKDNIVLFYTERYPEQPLVIKGAGAGADVTASGVFADIIRATQS